MKKIKHIEFDGPFNFGDRIADWNYDQLCRIHKEQGLILPTLKQLEKIGPIDELWLLPATITITVVFVDDSFKQWRFLRGFIWDKVTKFFGRNNEIEVLMEALSHDANFSCHFLGDDNEGFRCTNELFYKMLRCRKIIVNGEPKKRKRLSWIKARIYYRAVNSIVGRAFYAKNQRKFWHMKTVEFMER